MQQTHQQAGDNRNFSNNSNYHTNHQLHREYHHHNTSPPHSHAEHYPHEVPEKVLRVVKQSRRAIFGNYFVIFALYFFGYYGIMKNTQSNVLRQLGWFFIGAATIALIYSEVKINYKKLIISNKRAVLDEGILNKHYITIRYSSITEIILQQKFYQRLSNYGSIVIRTSGIKREQDLSIDFISNPVYVKKLLEHFMIGGA